MKNRYVPEKVPSFNPASGWQEISGGQHHSVALDKQGVCSKIIRFNWCQKTIMNYGMLESFREELRYFTHSSSFIGRIGPMDACA